MKAKTYNDKEDDCWCEVGSSSLSTVKVVDGPIDVCVDIRHVDWIICTK
jgi:hypothetical protein